MAEPIGGNTSGYWQYGLIRPGCNASGGIITVEGAQTDANTVIEYHLYNSANQHIRSRLIGANVSSGSTEFASLVNGTYKVNAIPYVEGVAQPGYSWTNLVVNCASPLKLTVKSTTSAGYQKADGSVTLEATGGAGGYSFAKLPDGAYQWSNVFAGLAAGQHTFQVADSNGALAQVVATVRQGFPPDGTFIRTQCYGVDKYEIVANGSGGERQGALVEKNSVDCGYVPLCDLIPLAPAVNGSTVQLGAATSFPPVLYSINGGAYSEVANISGLAPGIYTVSYKDSNTRNCSAQNSFEIVAVVNEVYYSRNPFWQRIEAPVGSIVTMELLAESEHYKGDFRFIVRQQKVATAEGDVHFRMDDVLDRLVKAEPPAGSETVFAKKNILNYYVRYQLGEGDWHNTPNSTVLLGGMPLESTWYSPFGHFLTSHPATKRVNPSQPEYLYWLCSAGTPALKIRRGTWLQGAAEPTYTVEPLAGLKGNQLLVIPAFGMLGASVRKVDIAILGTDDVPLSETRVYQVDPHPQPEERCFLFHNSWGGFDTLRCTGAREELTDSKEEIGERALLPGYQLQQGQRFVFSRSASRRYKQSTGPNAEWRQDYLQDFTLSMARFELRGAQLLPVLLTKKALENSTREDRRGYVFEYEYAFDTVGYAKVN